MGDPIVKDWASYGASDPEFDAIMAALPEPPVALKDMSMSELRAGSWQMPSVRDGVKEWDQKIPMRDGHKINLRIYQPDPLPEENCPLYVMYHGGGFVTGMANPLIPLRLRERYECSITRGHRCGALLPSVIFVA